VKIVQIKKVQHIPYKAMGMPSYSKQSPGLVAREMKRLGFEQAYDRGSGWAQLYTPVKIFLRFDGHPKLDVVPFFREHFNRLTKKRIAAILETAPTEIGITDESVSNADLTAWLTRVHEKLA
jgi:hypothetical protein